MNPKERIHKDWLPITSLLYEPELQMLNQDILPEISYQPSKENIFKVFEVPISSIKVVILGQDPYPSVGDATGLAFSVPSNRRIPQSLRNIATEISNNIEIEGDSIIEKMKPAQFVANTDVYPEWKTLDHWQKQGVFLLNTALTVETGKPGSHLKYWEDFTKTIVSFISLSQPCIWLLWGTKAQKFIPYINKNRFDVKGYTKESIKDIPINPDYNYVLTAAHPAAESYSSNAGFYGCNHFCYTNSILENKGLNKINW